MSEKNDVSLVDPTDTELTELDLHNAMLVVCGAATDVDDARDLLMMLGLIT